MMKSFSAEFVREVPERLRDGVLYVSIEYATVVHRCMCGCGKEVVTPLSPTDWSLTFNGEAISLDPSVGNWSFPCRSHYWIRNNRVHWSGDMPQELIDAGRARDKRSKAAYYAKRGAATKASAERPPRSLDLTEKPPRAAGQKGLLSRIAQRLLPRI